MSDNDSNGQQDSSQQRQTGRNTGGGSAQSGNSGQSEGGGGENQSGSNSQSGGGNSEQQQQRASRVEKGTIAISIILTLVLFSYAGWQIATPPETEVPQASVVETEPLADGSVAITVQLRNPKDVGLISATVESNCTSPPPQVAFSYVPASSTRTATLVCPAGTTDPSVSLSSWKAR